MEEVGETGDAGAAEPGLIHAAGRRFVLSFVAIAAIFFCLYCFPYAESGISETWIRAYLQGYARIVGFVLRLFEPGLVVSQNVVAGRFSMSIVRSCDAMEANMLFCAAVLAMPASVWRKSVALAAGLAALVAFNVVRLCCLYYVGVYWGRWFEVMHIEVWPLLMIAFATLDFLACARWVGPPGTAGASPPRAAAHVTG
jgi:exosortase/archaeosortase family protein